MNPEVPTLPPPEAAKASNLAFALGCLPTERRRDALIFYGFCRAVDDVADDPALPAPQKYRALQAWRRALEDGQLPELAAVIHRRSLDPALLHEIILGVESDIAPVQPATLQDLQKYCWRVASAVGLVSIRIFGCRDVASEAYAEELGYALQWTNILRDVGEDARLGRVYLPREDTARFGVSGESLLAGRPEGDFAGLMRFQAGRAREFFARAKSHLSPVDFRALTPAEMMREIYSRILARMEEDNFRVFQRRYRLGRLEKLGILLLTRLKAAARRGGAWE